MLDVLVLGSGVAGLSAAIEAARLGANAAVVTKGDVIATATRYAQGGVAAALTNTDSPELHLSDTLAAGAGICDVEAVRTLVSEGPARVLELIGMGAHFDAAHTGEPSVPGPDGRRLGLAREGGHSLNRVLHAGGDATGAEIERALAAALAASTVELREGVQAIDLEIERDRCVGIRALDDDGGAVSVRARHVVLASGGAGQLFAVTTNPGLSTGAGVAMAMRAGVAVADVEFMQFHPTALAQPVSPRPLLSEALRGEGAVLRDEHGVAFMVDEHPLADLAPRDVVSRCIARRLIDRGLDHLWLDATSIEEFPDRFPTIWRSCRAVGLDPRRDWLPVAPAAHYLCGGILTDLDGATTLPGLWACGEVAASGVHGANRLASNSLLDGLVFGVRAGQAITKGVEGPSPTGALRGVDLGVAPTPAPVRPTAGANGATAGATAGGTAGGSGFLAGVDELQRAMTNGCGVLRDRAGLAATTAVLRRLSDAHPLGEATSRSAADRRDLLDVAGALLMAASAREESRGSHTRTDFPERADRFLGRFVHQGTAEPVWVPLPEGDRAPTDDAPMSDRPARPCEPPITAVREAVRIALAEDLGMLGDLTVSALIDPAATATAVFRTRQAGVLAGTACASEAFAQLDPTLVVQWDRRDGDRLAAGEVAGSVRGSLASILTGERTALNFVCHLSGVATLTAKVVDAVAATGSRTTVLDTRKTLPGLRALQKAAVRAGGGANHRESLSDAVLVKDNHLRGVSIADAVGRSRSAWPGRAVEIECDTLAQVAAAKAAGADIVMCDNMTPHHVREAVALLAGAALVEVSGGLGLEGIAEYAVAGADFVSIGALTHSAPSLDLGLDIDADGVSDGTDAEVA